MMTKVMSSKSARQRSDVEDKTVWIDKKGKEKRFSVREVWKAIRIDCPKVIWYRHVWFSQCIPRHAFILWVAIKGKLKTLDRISRWINTQSMERNCRCFVKKFRDVDCLYKIVVEMIRMKLMGLTLKCNSNVLEAASIWNLKVNNSAYVRRMMEELNKDGNFPDVAK
ncbi:reverse transcriptase domain-containing protein [Tanacetum coccineum]